jgi:hypothetical protein
LGLTVNKHHYTRSLHSEQRNEFCQRNLLWKTQSKFETAIGAVSQGSDDDSVDEGNSTSIDAPAQHLQTMATTSQKDLKKLDEQVEVLQKQLKALIAKRRILVEAKCKEETPRDAFESRLAQLRLENPSWALEGPEWDCGKEDGDGEVTYYVQAANCRDANRKLDFLEDPDSRYWLAFDHYEQDAHFDEGAYTVYLSEGCLRVPKEKAAKKEEK